MTFHPRMQSKIDGIVVEGGLKWRAWNGVIADVWDVQCAPGAGGEYVSEYPRLFVVLDAAHDVSITEKPSVAGRSGGAAANRISYIPAGMKVWSHFGEAMALRHLDLHLDAATMGERFADTLDARAVDMPRLMFGNERIMALAQLIAGECGAATPLNDLYGESLAQALFIELFRIAQPKQRKRGQLSPWQLRKTTEFIEVNCMRGIRLQELAALTGLSQSYFSHAFKASTGVAPHQWQMRFRIRKVQELLARPSVSLTYVADAAGFADQAHLTRVFKQHMGITPAAWQRERGLRSGADAGLV